MSVSALPWRRHAAWFARTYGLSEKLFGELCFWSAAGDPRVWMATAHASPPASLADLANLGWPVLDGPLPGGAATALGLSIVGTDATRNVVELDAAQWARLREGATLAPPADADADLLVARVGKLVVGGIERATGRWRPAEDPASGAVSSARS